MSTNISRELIAQGVIVLAGAAGIAIGVLAPMASRVDDLETQLRHARELAIRSGELMEKAPTWRGKAEQCDAFDSWIGQQSRLAADPAELHELMTSIGERVGVEIDRIEPRKVSLDAGGRGRKAQKQPDLVEAAVGYSIDAVGSYQAIAEFVEALQNEGGFMRASAIRLAPYATEDADLTRASIETVHYAFKVPSAEQIAAMNSEAPQ